MRICLKILIPSGLILSFALLLMPLLFPLSGEAGSDWVAALGRFHILVLHFPIALILLVPVFEFLASFKTLHFLKQTIPVLMVLAVLFAVQACVLGYMLATGEGDSGRLLEQHMWGGIITTILVIGALIFHQLPSSRLSKFGYAGCLSLGIISLTLGSHKGASMVHGEHYLVEKLPASLNVALGIAPPANKITKDTPVYESLIRPIFQEHCFLCHSEAKQKGDFRLDDYERMLYGGESGMEGVVPGNLEDSEVYYRITLDPNKKGFMPPEGNAPLSKDQIALLRWWIESGASPTRRIEDLAGTPLPEAVEKRLTTILQTPPPTLPPMDQAAFIQLAGRVKEKYKIDIIRQSQDLADGAYIETRNAPKLIPAKAFEELRPLAPHIMSINLWRHDLGAGTAKQLSAFTHVKKIHLNETNVNENDLVHLTSMKQLKLLNLYGTAIGDDSVETLSRFHSLKTLLLADSAVTTNGVEQLKKKLPNCEINAFTEAKEHTNETNAKTDDQNK